MEGQYDVILSSMVLHVFEDSREVAEFIRRAFALLKPGGIFFGRNRYLIVQLPLVDTAKPIALSVVVSYQLL